MQRFFISFIVAFLTVSGVWGQKPSTATVSYFGIYLKDNKIGSLTFRREEAAQYNGKPAVRSESTMELNLAVMNTGTRIVSTTVQWTEPTTGFPLAVNSKTESGETSSSVSATYTRNSVTYSADVTGSVKKETLYLKTGESFLADPVSGGTSKPVVGLKLKGKVFIADPSVLKIVDSEIEITGREPITVLGQVIPAYKLVDKNPTAPSTLYIDDAGEMLRTDTILGMQIRREPKEMALAPVEKKAELLSLVGVRPTGIPLKDSRSLRNVQYEIKNVARSLPPSDSVQTVTYPRGMPDSSGRVPSGSVVVTITTRPLPDTPTVPLFVSKSDGIIADTVPERLRPFLQPTLYVQSDLPEFRNLAKEVVAGETDAGKAAARISTYVFATMRPDPTISNLRSASHLRRDPRGVCRDYTLFFTTIARAAGLPTKQCVGLVYANGSFFGHAWPEVWVGTDDTGKDTWVALEPTWGSPFADATHIKLSEGEITDFFTIAADLGRYEIHVLKAE